MTEKNSSRRPVVPIDEAKENGIPFPPFRARGSEGEDKGAPPTPPTKESEPANESEPPAEPEDPYEYPYDYQHDIRTDTMKGIQCVAFLLEWSSDIGNENVDGNAALGLSIILRHAAKEVGSLYTLDEVQEAGGDPFTLPHLRVKRVQK